MVVICTFANRSTPGLYNWQATMRHHGHDGVVVGMGLPWQGWTTRTREYYRYVESLPPRTLLVLIDAFDVLACRSPEDLVETFNSFHKPLVVSAEDGCIPYMSCLPVEKWWQQTQQKPNKYKYVNAGFMMGYREALLHVLKYNLESGIPDDQLSLGHYVEAFPEGVALDTESRLIATVTLGWRQDFRNEQGQAVRISSRAKPFFIHTPGMCWDLGRRYNQWGQTLLKADFKPYTSFGDAFPEMLRQSWFKFFLGIMFWLILILLLVAPKIGLLLLAIIFLYFIAVKWF